MTWATPVPILIFLGLSVLDLGPMYATDRRRQKHRLMPPPIRHNKESELFLAGLCTVSLAIPLSEDKTVLSIVIRVFVYM